MILTAGEFLRVIFQRPKDSETSCSVAESRIVPAPAAEEIICDGLTCSPEDSPVRTSATPGNAPGSKASAADCGVSTRESLASYDRATSLWRTSQLCLDGEWSEFLETWPRAGMTRNGKAYELPTLARRTEESESGLWPTPNVSGDGNPPEILTPHKNHFLRSSGQKAHLSLDQAATMFPTPRAIYGEHPGMKDLSHLTGHALDYRTPLPNETSNDYWNWMTEYEKAHGITPEMLSGGTMWPTPNATDGSKAPKYFAGGNPSLPHAVKIWATPRKGGSNGHSPAGEKHGDLAAQIGGQLNPTWVEWLMGYPLGWTDCADSATPSCRKSRNTSPAASLRTSRKKS